mgnify:FL=1
MSGAVEEALRARREAGGKSLVIYMTGALDDDFETTVLAVAAAGADVIEIGIPFSDPVMDGPVIQEANEKALKAGATPANILSRLQRLEVEVPLVVMTYYNIAAHMGLERFAQSLAKAGVAGGILPDMPLEETADWAAVADAAGVETILLAAPTGDDARLTAVSERSRGFIYGVGLLGVTGVRSELASSATEIARRLKNLTDLPVLIGVGIGTPEQAVEAAAAGDGVVVGTAVVARMLSPEGPQGVAALVKDFRAALDA